ncbi:hypothetical protein M5K25_002073 [Dendrobium thyrsiflorum]|uniref:Uncharacterized protein n=1 Tax=Dendrobium thyrsiflorum TaxID=117978 RepID=A0ABD0VTF5_DENTH
MKLVGGCITGVEIGDADVLEEVGIGGEGGGGDGDDEEEKIEDEGRFGDGRHGSILTEIAEGGGMFGSYKDAKKNALESYSANYSACRRTYLIEIEN